MLRTIIKYTFMLYKFSIVCANILLYRPIENLKQLTFAKSNVRSTIKWNEFFGESNINLLDIKHNM
jgi:hypothetical protein